MATSSSEVTSPSPFMSYLAYLPSLVRDWLLGRGWLALVALEKGRPCCRHQRGDTSPAGSGAWLCVLDKQKLQEPGKKAPGTGFRGAAPLRAPDDGRPGAGTREEACCRHQRRRRRWQALWLRLCKLRKDTGRHQIQGERLQAACKRDLRTTMSHTCLW